jgi:hypothetical protein
MRLLAAKMPHSIHFDEAYLFQRGFHPLAGTMSTILEGRFVSTHGCFDREETRESILK